MKKLIAIFLIIVCSTQPLYLQAQDDDWSAIINPYTIISASALIFALCHINNQHQEIKRLKAQLPAHHTFPQQQKLVENKAAQEELASLKQLFTQFTLFIPSMSVKESTMPIAFQTLLPAMGFKKSADEHPAPGLVTYISRSPTFSEEEKNFVASQHKALGQLQEEIAEINKSFEELDQAE